MSFESKSCQIFCVWCAKCTKYLAFGTFDTSTVDALMVVQDAKSHMESSNGSLLS